MLVQGPAGAVRAGAASGDRQREWQAGRASEGHGQESEERRQVMAIYKRGKIWWYKFNWNGEPIRESTKQSNKRTAEQMEATHKTSLAKGEVDRKSTRLNSS